MTDDIRNSAGDAPPEPAIPASAGAGMRRLRGMDLNFVIGVFMASLSFLLGVIILSGLFFPPTAPEIRYTAGVVLLLLSIYRMSVTIIRRRSHDRTPEE